MESYEATQKLYEIMRNGDIDKCISILESELNKIPESPFHLIMDLDFTNNHHELAEIVDDFIYSEMNLFQIKTIYSEMNGFSINPDRWYMELFAYDFYDGHEEYFWLSDYKSNESPVITLTGMETLQDVYKTSYVDNDQYGDSAGFTDFLVLLKYQKLIKAVSPLIKNLKCPLLATAHDYELVYEYN